MVASLGAVGSGGRFSGFEDADFDAYLPKKWGSNAYTLARRQAKDRLLSLARAVEEALTFDLEAFEMGASEESPSIANGRQVKEQSVYFTRRAEERSSLKSLLQKTDLASGAGLFDISVQHQHACLALRIDHTGLSVGVEVATKATVDQKNLAIKLNEAWAPKKFQELLSGLPEGALLSHGGEPKLASEVDGPAVDSIRDTLMSSASPLNFSSRTKRENPLLQSAQLVPVIVDRLESFFPLFEFLAWSRSNDFAKVKGEIQRVKEDKPSVSFSNGDRVTILSGLFAGRGGYLQEVDDKGKAKIMVGPVTVSVEMKDIKAG